MNVIHQASELAPGERGACLALGMFDGVHIGHQQVLQQTVQDARRSGARSVAITFEQHPSAVVAPERTPPLIYSLRQRLRVLESLGLDAVLLLRFDRPFSEQSAETFVTGLVRDFGGITSVCVGANFTFGHRRLGNVTLLKALGGQWGFGVHAMPPVAFQGKPVSSTRIRQAIQRGELSTAGAMLGRPYAIAGQVGQGRQLGRTIGFPTANLNVTGLVLPPSGVYAGEARANGSSHKAVANVGCRPTVPEAQPLVQVEVHLLDFQGDLYGQELEFSFQHKLRGEEKFASLKALQAQIEKDVSTALSLWQ